MTPLLAEVQRQEWYVIVAAAVIALGVIAFGWRDVTRFAFRRVRAIAGICFTEAIRRRVLWITPLAIIGVVAVSQLTRPFDEQDAIRQTTRYCLFGAGVIVIISAVLLACTNLPKEIENRVIFTIVTKPTTRLEIVLGKVMGFAMVSGVMLLIMGVFTLGYLELRAWAMISNARSELDRLVQEDAAGKSAATETAATGAAASRPSTQPANDLAIANSRRARQQALRRYIDNGLLATKAIQWPVDFQIYAKDPGLAGPESVRWMTGNQQVYCTVPLPLSNEKREAFVQAARSGQPAYLVLRLAVDRDPNPIKDELNDLLGGSYPKENEVFGPSPTMATARFSPRIQVMAYSPHQGHAVASKLLQTSAGVGVNQDPIPDSQWKPGDIREYRIRLVTPSADGRSFDATALGEFLGEEQVNIEISGATPTFLFGVGPSAVSLVVPGNSPAGPDFAHPLLEATSDPTVSIEPPDRKGAVAGESAVPPGNRFGGRRGRTGIQVLGRGPSEGVGAVAVYRFSEVADPEVVNGNVRFQLKVGIDRGGELELTANRLSTASLVVRNRKTGYTSPPVEFEPQTGRLLDEVVPAEAVAGGDFDVLIRGLTPGQQLALHGLTASVPSASLVTAIQPFALNLFKSLLVLWLVSILVVTISVFCSTFLSWPIAVVLTLLLLLGRWGVDTLGDALAPGSSRSVAQDLFKIRDPTKNKAVTDSMEALSTSLRAVGPILPDVSKFPVFEDIDRGVSIPAAKVGRAARELVVYGIPLVLLTYVILRRKEVAP